MSKSTPSTRLYVLLARKAPLAVVFRRGPSKQVLLLTWNTETHELRQGQWFKGRIYERRCDLSPSGEKLIYFAAKHTGPFGTWTAVSRPPFFTALAMWPKGDAWGGGGLFENERTIGLNHLAPHRKLAEGFRLPESIVVEPLKGHPGRGEDDPIHSMRLQRDGWTVTSLGKVHENKRASKIRREYRVPQVRSKSRSSMTLEMRILGVHETQGCWYVLEHRVLDSHGNVALAIGRSDWADWSKSGEILFARAGCLFRVSVEAHEKISEPVLVADLRDLRFEEVSAPSEVKVWSGREPRGRPIANPARPAGGPQVP